MALRLDSCSRQLRESTRLEAKCHGLGGKESVYPGKSRPHGRNPALAIEFLASIKKDSPISCQSLDVSAPAGEHFVPLIGADPERTAEMVEHYLHVRAFARHFGQCL